MRKAILLVLVLTSTFRLQAQEIHGLKMSSPCLYLPQGLVFESMSAEGFASSTGGPVCNAGSGNPASLCGFRTGAFGFSYQHESNAKPNWIADIGCEREEDFMPQSAGLIIPCKSFRIGFGMSQRFNTFTDFGPVTVVNPDDPSGYSTGMEHATKSERVIAWSGLFSYTFRKPATGGGRLSLGMRIDYCRLAVDEKMGSIRSKANAGEIGWAFGGHYRIGDRFQAGIFYEDNPSFQAGIETSGLDDGLIYNIVAEGRLPDRLRAGFLYRIVPSVKILFDAVQVYWNQVGDAYRNHVDLSGSLVYGIRGRLSLSAGFLSTDRRQQENFFEINGKLHGFFLLGGLNLKLRNCSVEFAYAAAAARSGEWRRQKIGKICMGFLL
jgi:hypothetical protein